MISTGAGLSIPAGLFAAALANFTLDFGVGATRHLNLSSYKPQMGFNYSGDGLVPIWTSDNGRCRALDLEPTIAGTPYSAVTKLKRPLGPTLTDLGTDLGNRVSCERASGSASASLSLDYGGSGANEDRFNPFKYVRSDANLRLYGERGPLRLLSFERAVKVAMRCSQVCK